MATNLVRQQTKMAFCVPRREYVCARDRSLTLKRYSLNHLHICPRRCDVIIVWIYLLKRNNSTYTTNNIIKSKTMMMMSATTKLQNRVIYAHKPFNNKNWMRFIANRFCVVRKKKNVWVKFENFVRFQSKRKEKRVLIWRTKKNKHNTASNLLVVKNWCLLTAVAIAYILIFSLYFTSFCSKTISFSHQILSVCWCLNSNHHVVCCITIYWVLKTFLMAFDKTKRKKTAKSTNSQKKQFSVFFSSFIYLWHDSIMI